MIDAFRLMLTRIEELTLDVGRERTLRELAERKADQAPLSPAEVVALVEHLAGDRKIDAIKSYRALTGHGLKESKDAIERVTSRLKPATSPTPPWAPHGVTP